MNHVYTPENNPLTTRPVTVFLAGSIEMGAAENWQNTVIDSLHDFDVKFFNPRRESWDSSWIQEECNPEFNQQVNWELNQLESADFILMNFCKDTKSPISLLELGLFANRGNLVVVCPREFWRSGNVQIICTRYRIPLYERLEDGIGGLKTLLYQRN
jgi:hypothetical protein